MSKTRLKLKRTARIAFWILLGAIISDMVYRFSFELLAVPTSSMRDTIKPGHYIWVNKLIPGPRFYTNYPEKYRRIKIWRSLKHGDIVVFNYPEADTIVTNKPGESYYLLKRQNPKIDSLINIEEWGGLTALRPTERPRMIKRLIALPGDTVTISKGLVYVNGAEIAIPISAIKSYEWLGSNDELQIAMIKANYEKEPTIRAGSTLLHLSRYQLELMGEYALKTRPDEVFSGITDPFVYPNKNAWRWNTHNMGPIYIPKRGETIEINPKNIALYKRIIEVFEEKNIAVKGNYVFNNNIPVSKYTFKMNYYWVHGDNLTNSFDSRYWGLLPENHLVGVVK